MKFNEKIFLCKDCGFDTMPTRGNEYYAVTDKIWRKVKGGKGMLCIGCLELRLGRTLIAIDFKVAPINMGVFPYSTRLWARLHAT